MNVIQKTKSCYDTLSDWTAKLKGFTRRFNFKYGCDVE